MPLSQPNSDCVSNVLLFLGTPSDCLDRRPICSLDTTGATGEALAAEITDARLVPLPGVGHQQPPPGVWGLAIPAIVTHTEHG